MVLVCRLSLAHVAFLVRSLLLIKVTTEVKFYGNKEYIYKTGTRWHSHVNTTTFTMLLCKKTWLTVIAQIILFGSVKNNGKFKGTEIFKF